MTSSTHSGLKSVSARIGQAIQLFYDSRMTGGMPFFRADDLRVFVEAAVGKSAPGSADRILRDMRQAGKLNYEVTDRGQSLYKLLPRVAQKGTEAHLEVAA